MSPPPAQRDTANQVIVRVLHNQGGGMLCVVCNLVKLTCKLGEGCDAHCGFTKIHHEKNLVDLVIALL